MSGIKSRSPFAACKLGLVAVKYPEWQRSNHIELMGFGREFSAGRMVIIVWEWEKVCSFLESLTQS